MTYTLIVVMGFLFSVRGARQAFAQRPGHALFWVWREATDLFLTLGLIVTLLSLGAHTDACHGLVREYPVLLAGTAALFLTRYQKKNELFFLFTAVQAFMVFSESADPVHGISLAWAVTVGIALFQTCFLGLRYKLLFSNVPRRVRGWPVFCLLAAFISLVLWGASQRVF